MGSVECRSRVGASVVAAVAVVAGLAALQHQRRRGTSMVDLVRCRSRVGALVAAAVGLAAAKCRLARSRA